MKRKINGDFWRAGDTYRLNSVGIYRTWNLWVIMSYVIVLGSIYYYDFVKYTVWYYCTLMILSIFPKVKCILIIDKLILLNN